MCLSASTREGGQPSLGTSRKGRPAGLASVVEDDAQGVALAREETAHSMPHRRAICAARADHRPVARGEDDGLALLEMHHAPARLGARPLLHEQELAAREVLAGLTQEYRELEGKHHIAVE